MSLKIITDWSKTVSSEVPDYVSKQYPDAHFVYANATDAKRMAAKRGRGYEIVKIDKKTIDGECLEDGTEVVNGTVRRGDSILMACHEKTFEARNKYIQGQVDKLVPKRMKKVSKSVSSDDRSATAHLEIKTTAK